MAMTTYANPPDFCDICNGPIKASFYDAFVRRYLRLGQSGQWYGRWAILCPDCFVREGCRLGTGAGQRYEALDPANPETFTKTGG